MYLPHATSLRMGRLGYQSDAQSNLHVSYNNLKSYSASLQEALTRPYPPYEKIGIRDGDFAAPSTSLLQIENEFYSPIRPKRRIKPGERPLHALRERGVEYVEVRLMDLDPFTPVGITARPCASSTSCCCTAARGQPARHPAGARRSRATSCAARKEQARPAPRARRGDAVTLAEWGKEVLDARADRRRARCHGGAGYRDALNPRNCWACGNHAVRARAARDGAQPWQLARALHARRIARAPRHAGRHPAAGRGRGALREADARIDREAEKDRSLGPDRLRDLPPALPEPRVARGCCSQKSRSGTS